MKQQEDIAFLQNLVRDRIQRSLDAKQKLLVDSGFHDLCVRAALRIVDSFRSGGKLLFFGNGGSPADAQHLAAEFTGRYSKERPGLPPVALGVNPSSVTSIGNDYGFDLVFARELDALGKQGDVAVGISTSGNSRNVIRTVEVAKLKSIYTLALTGASGGNAEKHRGLHPLYPFRRNSTNSRVSCLNGPHNLRDCRTNDVSR